MNTVGLLVNVDKLRADDDVGRLASEAVTLLASRRVAVVVNEESARTLGVPDLGVPDADLVRRADVLVVFGGDGTILRAARLTARDGIPILGVNLGGFGFLAEVHDQAVEDALLRVLAGDYRVDERMMLQAQVCRDGAPEDGGTAGRGRVIRELLALNDVVVAKSGYARILRIRTDVNEDHLATHLADGLIVATPTGSTAYSLSAGGPILHPELDAIVLTPICAHTLNARAVVLSANEAITVRVQPTGAPSVLTVDGQEGEPLEPDDVIRVARAPYRTRLVRLGRTGFYRLLRAKLSWGGER
ncbi:MAG TPA: NAD(+)/NADH kinase [bacterium]|nr:NAD(+)/NADH kinase [bacterium]